MIEIKVNDALVLTISDDDIKILSDSIDSDLLVDDVIDRVKRIFKNKIDQSYSRMQKQWLDTLLKDESVTQIPADKNDFVDFVKARPDYKDKKQRDSDERAENEAKSKKL